MRLKGVLDDAFSADPRYFEAVGIVLVHELLRSGRDVSVVRPPLRGGLAAWQQQVVTRLHRSELCEADTARYLVTARSLEPVHFFGPSRNHLECRRIGIIASAASSMPSGFWQTGNCRYWRSDCRFDSPVLARSQRRSARKLDLPPVLIRAPYHSSATECPPPNRDRWQPGVNSYDSKDS